MCGSDLAHRSERAVRLSGALVIYRFALVRRARNDKSRGHSNACRLTEQQAGFPAHALCRRPQLLQRPILDLPHAFLADSQEMADLPQAVRAVAGETEPQVEHLALPRPKILHQEMERFLSLG